MFDDQHRNLLCDEKLNVRPLQVALLLETSTQPAWVVTAIENIVNSPFVRVSSVAYLKNPIATKYGAVYQAYQELDHKFFGLEPDPFVPTATEKALPSLNPYFIEADIADGCYNLSQENIPNEYLSRIEICIYFGKHRLTGDILNASMFGVWSHGGGYRWQNQEDGSWAVLRGQSITSTGLWILKENPQNDILVYRSFSATHTHSVCLNYRGHFWKASEYIQRKLRDVAINGRQALSPIQTDKYNEYYSEENPRFQTTPTNWGCIQASPRLLKNYLNAKLESRVYKPQWFIGYKRFKGSLLENLNNVNCVYLDPPPNCHWADPFPYVTDDGHSYIFAEEILYPDKKGHLVVFDLEEGKKPITVLKKDYHLSYPFLFKWQDTVFLMPESSQNQTIEIYHSRKFPYEWELETKFFEGIKAVDSTLIEIGSQWWLFTNIANKGNNYNDELYLFYASTPFGPWHPHPTNPIISDVRYARPAGNIFQVNGNFYRPSQDCSKRYGYQIVINQIIEINSQVYREKPVHLIQPNWRHSLLANHTLNMMNDLMVMDGYRLTKGIK